MRIVRKIVLGVVISATALALMANTSCGGPDKVRDGGNQVQADR